MSTIHVCDRCKAATTNPTVLVLMDIRTVQSEHPGELCEGCLAKLRAWLRGESEGMVDGVWHSPKSPGWRS